MMRLLDLVDFRGENHVLIARASKGPIPLVIQDEW